MNRESHPLDIQLEQILPILAKEIYSNPLSFLRENVQNAFDAIRMQIYREKSQGIASSHRITIGVKDKAIEISDTGIGMTASDMKEYYWSVGKTGKNTHEAKAAGVVGTFGIGGMANFGVADEIQLISRTQNDSPGTISYARRDELSTSKDCIYYKTDPTLGTRGTSIIAKLTEPLNPNVVISYLKPIVRFIDIPVFFNGNHINGDVPPWKDSEKYHKDQPYKFEFSGYNGNVSAELSISADVQGRPAVTIQAVKLDKNAISCEGILRASKEAVSTYRFGFHLADIGLVSLYSLGGHINCEQLKPTAGRDTLDSESRILLQRIVEIAELGITMLISSNTELSETNTNFFRYIHQNGKHNLLDFATVRIYGIDHRVQLKDIRTFSLGGEVFFSRNADRRVMEVLSKQGKQIALLSDEFYRSKCEEVYLKKFCKAKVLDTSVTAVKEFQLSDITETERVFILGIESILRTRYLVENVRVLPAELTEHALVWVPKNNQTDILTLWLDLQHPHAKKIISMRGSLGYGQLIDLFIRDYIFPMIKDAIPSVSSEGFEIILQRLQGNKEIMVINPEDIRSMQELGLTETESGLKPEEKKRKTMRTYSASSEMFIVRTDIIDGRSIEKRAAEQGLQIISEPGDVLSGVPQNVLSMKQSLAQLEIPEIILDFTSYQELSHWISGLYVGLTLEAFSFYKEIIQRQPKIQFVWGGYRASYLFFESEEGVLYYDLEFSSLLRPKDNPLVESGAISFDREPLFAKNNIFLPIPTEFSEYFMPKVNPITIVVRHQILTPETQSTIQ